MKTKRILKIFMVFLFVFSLLIPKFLSINSHTVTANDNSINDDWTIDDFIIENDTIYGFSNKGAEKLKKNGKVILPTEKNGIKITKVASFAFHPDKKKLKIISVVKVRMAKKIIKMLMEMKFVI